MLKASRTIHVRGLKVTTLLPPAELVGLTPPEPAPAPDVIIDLSVDGTDLVVRAKLGGRAVRKAEKAIAAAGGPENVVALCQGSLRGPRPRAVRSPWTGPA
jgi:hypothetical protein